MKHCWRCDQWKSFEDFYKSKDRLDGFQTCCKECSKEQAIRWQKKNPDRFKEIYLAYINRDSERIREKRRERYLRSMQSNPDYNREQWAAIKADPVRHEALLARKREEYRRRKLAQETTND